MTKMDCFFTNLFPKTKPKLELGINRNAENGILNHPFVFSKKALVKKLLL